MKFKYNWGWGILIFYIIFALFLAGNIVYSSFLRNDLVEEDYYESELQYQEQINKMNRTKEAKAMPEIVQGSATIAVTFPDIKKKSDITGKYYFYRPSNAQEDIHIDIALNDNFFQTIDISKFPKGLWYLKIDWSVNDASYYYEKEIIIKQ
jgi:hypothetical protein